MRDDLACSWCESWFSPRREHPNSEVLYCKDACRAAANRAEPKERKTKRARALKAMGMDTAAQNNRWQLTIARWAALMCFREGASISCDVRAWCAARGIELEWAKPWSANVLHGCPWFQRTGERKPAYHEGSNGRYVNEYRLTAEGWAAVRGMIG